MRTLSWQGHEYVVRSFAGMPSSVRNDDFILYDDKVLYQVVTIQPNIPHWESWRHTYTMFTLQAEDGRILPVPNLHGEHIIARPLRKVS